MQKLHVILSCTNRKRTLGRSFVRLRSVDGNIDQRASSWISLMDREPPVGTASGVYVGDYWHSGLALVEAASARFDVSGWVLSAGLGLIELGTDVPPYSATFAPRHPDCVARSADARSERRRWWALLSVWPGPSLEMRHRSLRALAVAEPDAAFLLCVGPTYLDAVHDDLLAARNALNSPDQLIVLTSASGNGDLAGSIVRIAGRFRTSVGGSMVSISPRVARAAIEMHDPGIVVNAGTFRGAVERVAASSGDLPRFDRSSRSDEAIRRWISEHRRSLPAATRSSSLRAYRDAGFACEQSRFGRLFENAEAE